MNLAQLLARLQEITNELNGLPDDDSVETINKINALSDEYEEKKSKADALQKREALKNASTQSAGRQVAPTAQPAAVVANVSVGKTHEERTFGFASAGNYFRAVKDSKKSGKVDDRLIKFSNAAQESFGEDGAFLIPEDYRDTILKKVEGDESLLPRTTELLTASNHMRIPTSEKAPWDSSGTIKAYWQAEASAYTATKDSFGSSLWELSKLIALVNVTDELLEDAPALQSWINVNAPVAMLHKINEAIISGSGVGRPKGFLTSGFAYETPKEAGQTADTVNYNNIVNMYSHLLPMSIAKSVWLINPSVQPELLKMQFVLGATSPVPAYLPPAGLSAAPYGTLMGRPIIPLMGGVSALGDVGDISLVDLSYYITARKTSGIKSSTSIHVYFESDIQSFKFSMRIAGQCPYSAPVSPQNGTFPMSGFVTLQAR